MTLPASLARAYARSRYSVAGVTLHVGRKSRALDGLLAGLGTRDASLLTAWNPHGIKTPGSANARMMRQLRDRLGRTPCLPASGSLARWHEAHLLVSGDVRRLSRLARVFRQNAIVRLRRGQAPRLLVLC